MALVSTQIAQNRSTPFLCAMFMPGNPNECRKHAARCAEMTVAARTRQLKATFLELSKNWEKLAIQLEYGFAQPAESQDIRSDVRETLHDEQ